MNKTNISNDKTPNKHKNQRRKETRLNIALEVGRILITYPRYGRLDVYMKRGRNLGLAFVCEEDGGRYGVTIGVKKRFPNIGSYNGWGYIGANQTVVFKFLLKDQLNTPQSLIVIKTSDGNVDLSASIKNRGEYADGAIVAFYSRFVGRNPASLPRREATDVFPVDVNHLPLVARLISGGSRLTFPDHNEVVEIFLDSLPSLENLDRQNFLLFDSALTWLATNSGVPAQFQQLARVEQTKIASARIEQVNAPLLQHRGTITEERKDTRIKPTSQIPAKGTVVGDVVQVKLQLD